MAPTNVLMVLVSARCNVSLEDLAHLADKIMVVASPSISKVHVPLRVEMSLFCFFSCLFFFPAILLFSTYFSEYFA